MVKKKKYRSIEQLKSRYGLMFVSPWIFGFIVFFLIPVIQSIIYSFSDVLLDANGVKTIWLGIEPYKKLLGEDPNFMNYLTQALTTNLYSLPIILLVSIVLALLLNKKFAGRLFFRALYFMPVIIASGVVITLVFDTTSENITGAGVNSTLTNSMFSVEDVVGWLSLPDQIATYVKLVINNIFDLLWSCGIQTVLFIAGLQSIPTTLYEASKVEGATKWEEFWFITFPSLGSVILLVSVYTMVDMFTSSNLELISSAYKQMNAGIYDTPSTMLWIYFVVVGAFMGLILFLYNRLLMKRWQ